MKKIEIKNSILATFVVASSVGSSSADTCPIYPEDLKTLIYAEFKRELVVRDAYIGQDDCDLTLALVVNAATSEEYAKDLGDRFVRLTKALGAGPSSSKQIGKGIYNFLVGVYTAQETKLALGAKAAGSTRILWK